MMTSDIPLFRSTEEAEAFGRALRLRIGPDDFQTLVRTWLVSELAAREAVSLQAKANLAVRSQTLREAVQEFLGIGTDIGGGKATIDVPASRDSLVHEDYIP